MSYLLDTHVLIWWLADDPQLPPAHRAIIGDGRNRILVSSVSIAEMHIKSSLGKLDVPDDLDDAIDAQGFENLAFDARHSSQLRELPWHHRDPFDRMLISQAREDRLVFLTADSRCRRYDVVTK